MTAGQDRDLQTTVRALAGDQKLLPTPISPRGAITSIQGPAAVSTHCLARAGEGPLPPPLISSAFPPPFISFGFSPLIKLLACRIV